MRVWINKKKPHQKGKTLRLHRVLPKIHELLRVGQFNQQRQQILRKLSKAIWMRQAPEVSTNSFLHTLFIHFAFRIHISVRRRNILSFGFQLAVISTQLRRHRPWSIIRICFFYYEGFTRLRFLFEFVFFTMESSSGIWSFGFLFVFIFLLVGNL